MDALKSIGKVLLRAILIIICFGCLMYLAYTTFGNISYSNYDYSSSKNVDKQIDYTISKQYKDTYSYNIEGIATNNSSGEYGTAMITFSCYDKDNNKVGTATDMVSNFKSGEKWKFKATYFGKDAVKCEFDEINAY